MKFLREPFLHFFILGAFFFGLYEVVNPTIFAPKNQITIEAGRVISLIENFDKKWNRTPTDSELVGLVDNYILEEIYYRKALEFGLDKNDVLIRRRLRQKMEFLTSSIAAQLQPSDEELIEYYKKNSQKYSKENSYSFEQVYINRDRSSDDLSKIIEQIQISLADGLEIKGDLSPVPLVVENMSKHQVIRIFGKRFSEQLDDLPSNQWIGPVESGLGIHFIFLENLELGLLQEFEEIQEQVKQDWVFEKSKETLRAAQQGLKDEYIITINWPESVSN